MWITAPSGWVEAPAFSKSCEIDSCLFLVKAPSPKGLQLVNEAGLDNFEIEWQSVQGAKEYVIYINGTIRKTVQATRTTIDKLSRKTFYNIMVASINLAGTGNTSDPVNVETADIGKTCHFLF